MNEKILLIEDEARLRRILGMVLKDNGFKVTTAENGKEGIKVWKTWGPDIVITDIKMKPMDGFEVLAFGQQNFSDIPVIILTAFGTVETAVTAMKQGAFDFVTKPVNHNQLITLAGQALASKNHAGTIKEQLMGECEIMETVRRDISLFASTDSSVLITGESGTGKELAARAIHQSSRRSEGPMVRVNCAAIPRDLLESELFGHKKGAFTGATDNREGAFSKADGGIIFLDEIGDLPLALQPKLLHAVEEKVITPVGSTRSRPVSVKILSATNLDLEDMILKKIFRADLFYRLNTVCLTMPALRERPGDVDILTDYFIEYFATEFNQPGVQVSRESRELLQRHSWPGNVRELKNTMERAVLISHDNMILPEHLFLKPKTENLRRASDHSSPLDLVAQEQNLLLVALTKCRWNQSQAARELGITRSALRYRLQKYGIGTQQG
ncbi:MAG: sigma-54 dependent transcriptional regulator [Desulfobacula sp.]|nr:sigma-54 dependent transcriptional regulator [Desulfobacula sp.]